MRYLIIRLRIYKGMWLRCLRIGFEECIKMLCFMNRDGWSDWFVMGNGMKKKKRIWRGVFGGEEMFF